MSDGNVLDQNEIERLLSGMGAGEPVQTPPPAESAADSASNPVPASNSGILSQEELNALFNGAASTPTSPPPLPSSPPPIAATAAAEPSPTIAPLSSPPPPPPSPPPFTNAGNSGGSGWDAPTAAFDTAAFDTVVEDEEEGIPRGDLDYLAKKADESLRSIAAIPMNLPNEVIEFQFPEFGGTVPSTEHATLDQISEVDLDVKVELGRTYMYIEDVLRLRRGSVVPLDKMAGETVDIYINGRLLAKGEVLVMNENFCVRIAELLAGAIPME